MKSRLFGQPFAYRLPERSTAADLCAMAQSPSYRAPRAKDVLHAKPFVPPASSLGPDEHRLMTAVIAAPDDDAPRWAYADWCIANGATRRAEFIRQQLTTGPAGPADPAWATIFQPWCARDIVYRRGFVEAMSLAGRAFLTLGAPLLTMTPLREVRLVAIAPYLNELVACPHLARLCVLDLRGNRIRRNDCDGFEREGLTILCDG